MRDKLVKNSKSSIVMALLFLLLIGSLSACGQKGPLRRPEQDVTEHIPGGKTMAVSAVIAVS